MPNNWLTYKLGDIGKVQTGPFGSQLHQKDYVVGGTPLVTVKNLGEKRINKNNLDGVSVKDVKRLKKYVLREGDIVFSRVGINIDRSSLVTEEEYGWIFSSSTLMLRLIREKVCPEFLIYVLNTETFKNYIRTVAVGATRPSLNTSILSNSEAILPPIQEQKAIAKILSAIDDKIENNLAINKTLEDMAMALYKHWFVDFGPFQDGEFINSELGLIPNGWEVKQVKEIFNITIGRTPPRKEPKWFSKDNGVKWISIKDLGNSGSYIFETSEFLTTEAVEKFRVPIISSNTVMLSFKLTVGRVAIATETMLSNEAIAHFNEKEKGFLGTEYLYLYLKNFDFKSLGSTSSIATAVNSQTIKNINCLIPKVELKKKFEKQVQPFFEQIKNNQIENQTLTKIRDTLLPKLISGEVRLKQFREQIEEVL